MSATFIGLKALKLAVKRNPQKVLNEGRNFISRGLAAYKRGIIRSPWRLRSNAGGAPVSTGHLRDTHITKVSGLKGTIGPNLAVAPYARYVHHGTRRMPGRPWLDYVKDSKSAEIETLYRRMLKNIVGGLAK